ncbi:MAG: DUF1049 domain-containing protein [Bacteroidetes bacterium]|nr:DUF1049 domain-containing protein [Bacteroidota bacterium]
MSDTKNNKSVFFWILAGIILIVALIFSIQNHEIITVRLLFIDLKGPLFVVIVSIFFLGYLLGRIWSIIKGRKEKKIEKKEEKEQS